MMSLAPGPPSENIAAVIAITGSMVAKPLAWRKSMILAIALQPVSAII